MRHHGWIAIAVLAMGLLLAPGQWAGAADKASDLADQLNAQWSPNPPAYSVESVGQQRGQERFGGWGGVLIGNLIAQAVAKSILAAPNNTLTPQEALALATQQVMDARQSQSGHGWGRISQDLTGQKLGDLMKGAQPGTASTGGRSSSLGRSAKGSGKPAGPVPGRTEHEFSNSFSTRAQTGVVVSGPGASGGTGRGHDKGASGKDVADRGGNRDAGGRGGGDGHGGGNGGGGGRGGGDGHGGGNGGGGGGGGGGGNGGGGNGGGGGKGN